MPTTHLWKPELLDVSVESDRIRLNSLRESGSILEEYDTLGFASGGVGGVPHPGSQTRSLAPGDNLGNAHGRPRLGQLWNVGILPVVRQAGSRLA